MRRPTNGFALVLSLTALFMPLPGEAQKASGPQICVLAADSLSSPWGPGGARDEFHLAATVQNLRKLAKLTPARRQSPPPEGGMPITRPPTVGPGDNALRRLPPGFSTQSVHF